MQNIHCFQSAIGNYGDGNSILCLTAWSSNYHAPRQLIGTGSLSLPVPIIYFLPISLHSSISATCNPNNGLHVFFCSSCSSLLFQLILFFQLVEREKQKIYSLLQRHFFHIVERKNVTKTKTSKVRTVIFLQNFSKRDGYEHIDRF